MEPNEPTRKSKPKSQKPKRNVFQLMNNVRDNCGQSDALKVFLFSLVTYCDSDGICWPSNATLAKVTRKSLSSVKRMLRALVAGGELEILEPGVGRDKKRVLRLTKYVDVALKTINTEDRKGAIAMTPLNGSASVGKTHRNYHSEQPKGFLGKKTGSATRPASFKSQSRSLYPKSERAMLRKLKALGIEADPEHDGQFFQQMDDSGWKIRGKRVRDWPKVYLARVQKVLEGPKRKEALTDEEFEAEGTTQTFTVPSKSTEL